MPDNKDVIKVSDEDGIKSGHLSGHECPDNVGNIIDNGFD
jgi:hypothetical protein